MSGRPVFAKATPWQSRLRLRLWMAGLVRTETPSFREVFSAHRAHGFSPAVVGWGKDLFGEI